MAASQAKNINKETPEQLPAKLGKKFVDLRVWRLH